MDRIDRPLDLLNNSKGKEICVYLKNEQISGELLAFDIHINLVLKVGKKPVFIRGDNVIKLEPLEK